MAKIIPDRAKMEAVGRLAGGAAHDLNNILGAIEGYATLTLNSLKAGDPSREDMEEIRRAVARAAGLTRKFFIFGLKQPAQTKTASLNAAIERLRPRSAELAALGIKLELRPDPGLPETAGDAPQLDLLLDNLVSNARDAMPAGGTLAVSTSLERVAAGDVRSRDPAAAGGSFGRLSVRDSGAGIAPGAREHLFEPFFTTKEKGKGAGLGLAIVYGLARQTNGWVEAESEPGQGAEFSVFLPVVAASVDAA